MASNRDRTGRGRALVLLLAVLALVATACGSGDDDGGGGGGGASAGSLEGITRDTPIEVGAVSLPEVQADGTTAPFRFRAPDGQLLFVAFGYTNCPDVCPTTLSDIRKALEELGEDAERVEVAFATVDPERDTAEVMTSYLGSFVEGGHPLRSDDAEELQAAEEAFGITSQVVKNADGTVDVAHTARSFVIDDAGRIVVEWSFGTNFEAMAGDLRVLLARQGS